jgi:AAA+ superfamily predicted ATPase
MATADQIIALLRSYSESDGTRFLSIATQIAAHEARGGRARNAVELRNLIDQIKEKQAVGKIGGAVPIARPRGELVDVLLASYPNTRISEMVLPPSTRAKLERVIIEHRKSSRLKEHGLRPRRKLLLVGPPGCGKTMTACALAGETKLPLFAIQLHGLLTKFLGETAAKLHSIFDAMCSSRGVYLFDEFDAIGGHRSAGNDVGEIRRVLNSFLQFLENDDSESLIVCATNHEELLDKALFRRFDDVVEYGQPSAEDVLRLMKTRLGRFRVVKVDWECIKGAAVGLSHADIAQACDDAAKNSIILGKKIITGEMLLNSMRDRTRSQIEG